MILKKYGILLIIQFIKIKISGKLSTMEIVQLTIRRIRLIADELNQHFAKVGHFMANQIKSSHFMDLNWNISNSGC